MSFKYNWGHGIATAIAMFVIFISYFVYKTLADPEYEHALVSEEYYKDALHFQNDKNRLKNASNLKQDVIVKHSDKGLEFVFPKDFDYQKIIGQIELQRTNNEELDYETNLKLDSSTYLVPDKMIVRGRYNIQLKWEYDSIPYLLNKKITY